MVKFQACYGRHDMRDMARYTHAHLVCSVVTMETTGIGIMVLDTAGDRCYCVSLFHVENALHIYWLY